ncbi:Metallo-dependent phosphatase [Panus rudis PR-1116 ss-1]|nr:Metallo-dependent phosphatase [Panus rudis PR-1116 ss-1]
MLPYLPSRTRNRSEHSGHPRTFSSTYTWLTRLKPRPVNLLRLFWIILIVWYEIGTFYYHARRCKWPETTTPDLQLDGTFPSTHVLLVADPQILNHRSYPGRDPFLMWITQRLVDMYMRKSWRAVRTLKPDTIIFLGDMMDGGRFAMSDEEYEAYYTRFRNIFADPDNTPTYYIPGNHDIGLGDPHRFSPVAYERYRSHFGPLNQVVEIGNHSFVMINAPGLVDEDYARESKGVSFARWAASMPGGPIEFISTVGGRQPDVPKILLTHIPLARPDGTDCGPLREKGTIRQGTGFGYQNTLSDEASDFVLQTIRPSVIFSGDDHDYCEYWHEMDIPGMQEQSVKEISVKSFSMAMGIKVPGFQLLSLFPPSTTTAASENGVEPGTGFGETFRDVPCFLPSQLGIWLHVYVPCCILSLFVLFVSNFLRTAWRATTPTTLDESIPLHKTTDSTEESSDGEEDALWMASLPTPASSVQRTFPRHPPSRTSCCSKSWSFVLCGKRRRMTFDVSSCLFPILAVFFEVGSEGRSRSDSVHYPVRRRMGVVRGFLTDVLKTAWPVLLLFALIVWYWSG